MKYSIYTQLCRDTMKSMDGGFSHLFLTSQWNLMCRSKSTETIDFDHISNEDDAIGVVFHKTKSNQSGKGAKDPRHIYGNPFQPDTCWMLALGIYLACNPTIQPRRLFPGKKIDSASRWHDF